MHTKQSHWFSLVSEQEQSNLTINSFCTSKGIKSCTFHYWRKRYRYAQRPSAGFVELDVPAVPEAPVRIVYPNGISIHLPAAHISLIAQLLHLG